MTVPPRKRIGIRTSTSLLPGGSRRISKTVSRSWRPFRRSGPVPALLLLAGIGLTSPAPVLADDDVVDNGDGGEITVELNRLEDVEKACRLSFVFTNTLPVAVEGLAIEAVLFDANGQVDRFLLLKARPLAPAKTRVQQFDVGQATCPEIGSVLLNDVTACAGDGLDAAACLDAVRPTSRADVPFDTALTPDSQ